MPTPRRWLWTLVRMFVPNNVWLYRGRARRPGVRVVPPPGPAADVPVRPTE